MPCGGQPGEGSGIVILGLIAAAALLVAKYRQTQEQQSAPPQEKQSTPPQEKQSTPPQQKEKDKNKKESVISTKDKFGDRQQPHVDKARARLEWWQRLQQLKPELVLPDLQIRPSGEQYQLSTSSDASAWRAAHKRVAHDVDDRMKRGKDWLVRDSDYQVDPNGPAPAHSNVKAKVNEALVKAIIEVSDNALPEWLAKDPRRIMLLLDTPRYGTLREIAKVFPAIQCCQQVVVPQADLGHYFEMTRSDEFYPGVRAQRLDHWLCANGKVGFKCIAAFLDYECRLIGSMSARLCPAADIMRYFRYGYPAEPASVFAITVGLEEPAPTPEEVDAFVKCEAALNGYTVELREVWKYRMATLLYIVRRAPRS